MLMSKNVNNDVSKDSPIRSYAAEKCTKMKSSRAKCATETTVFII